MSDDDFLGVNIRKLNDFVATQLINGITASTFFPLHA
jgi:hypothetical protein